MKTTTRFSDEAKRMLAAYEEAFGAKDAFDDAPVLDVPEVIALEQAAVAAGTPLIELMKRAGAAVAWRARRVADETGNGCYPPWEGRRATPVKPADGSVPGLVAVLCGNGNNGGDGWVAAALLAQAGIPVCVLAAKLPENLTAQPAHDAALEALEILKDCGGQVLRTVDPLPTGGDGPLPAAPIVLLDDAAEGEERPAVAQALGLCQVVVDAIMGTGAAKTPRHPFIDWIAETNRLSDTHAVIAVDIPTGVDARGGQPVEPHVVADETVTMIVRKPGSASKDCGKVSVAPLIDVSTLP